MGWGLIENIKGATGATGPTGPPGVTGAFFSAAATGTTNVPSGTYDYVTTIALANIIYTDGHFAANAYTCPVVGHYLFCGEAQITATAAGLCGIGIRKNGGAVGQGVMLPTSAATNFFSNVTAIISCVPGDVITLGARADGAATVPYAAFMGQIQ